MPLPTRISALKALTALTTLTVAASVFAAPGRPIPGTAAAEATRPQQAPHGTLFAQAPTIDRLENGLTLVTLKTSSPGVIAYFTLVRAGSRDEVEPGKSGYAHLFEHLMFRGTKAISARDYELR